MNFTREIAQFLAVVSVITMVSACGSRAGYVPPAKKEEVEISPGVFIVLHKSDWTVDDPGNTSGEEQTRLKIPYRGEVIHWEGVDIPVVLREHEQRLYMIGYDRETGRRSAEKQGKDWHERHCYYRQDDERLIEISPDEFPKEIAIQNMWLQDVELQEVLELNTASIGFRLSSTAYIWEELMTGKTSRDSVDKHLLDEYIRLYKPVNLTMIKRRSGAGESNSKPREKRKDGS